MYILALTSAIVVSPFVVPYGIPNSGGNVNGDLRLRCASGDCSLSAPRVIVDGPWMPLSGVRLVFGTKTAQGGTGTGCFSDSEISQRLVFTRASTANVIVNGAEQSCAIDKARIDEDGLIVEPGAINEFGSPNTFNDGAKWAASQVTITSGLTAPDGTATAWTVATSAAASPHIIGQAVTLGLSTTYTFSVYARHISGPSHWLMLSDTGGSHLTVFNLSTGAMTSSSTRAEREYVGNGWWRIRISLAKTPGAQTWTMWFCDSDAMCTDTTTQSTFGIWRAQLEANHFATTWAATAHYGDIAMISTPWLGPQACYEASISPVHNHDWQDDNTNVPILTTGNGLINTVKIYANDGAIACEVLDSAGNSKSCSVGVQNPNSPGPKGHVACCLNGAGGISVYWDWRYQSCTPSGAGLGYIAPENQYVVYLGSTAANVSGPIGGWKFSDVTISRGDVPQLPPDGQEPTGYAFYHGYVANSRKVAVIGGNNATNSYVTEYPQVLASLLDQPSSVANGGRDVNTSQMALTRWRNDIRGRGYGTLIVDLGNQDVRSRMSTALTKANIAAIVSEARTDGMDVIVLNLLPGAFGPGGAMADTWKQAALLSINSYIASMTGVTVVDQYALFDDGTAAHEVAAAFRYDVNSVNLNQDGADALAAALALVVF